MPPVDARGAGRARPRMTPPPILRIARHRMRGSPDDLRRWVANHRAAERREQSEEAGRTPDPSQALVAALRLIAIARERHGWPLPSDPSAVAEDERTWATWA